jgi:hypothetical protein
MRAIKRFRPRQIKNPIAQAPAIQVPGSETGVISWVQALSSLGAYVGNIELTPEATEVV